MAKQTPTFYVLHGNDDYSLKDQIKTMQDAMNDPNQMNTTILNGADTSAQAALNTVSSYPFLSDKRLVIVEGLLTHLAKRGAGNKAEIDILLEGLPKLPDFARLVFAETDELSASNKVLKLAEEAPNGFAKNFATPSNPARWISQQAKKVHGVEIENEAANALASVINKDMRVADSELAKLAAYVDYSRPITIADVASLTAYVAEASIFDMVDAIAENNGKTAMQLTRDLMAEGSDPIAILAMINRQFRLLILAKEYQDEGNASGGMAKAIGVHPFVAQKLGTQVRRFREIGQLERIYKKLVELDFEIKTGKIPSDIALQLFITGVTG